MNLKLVRLERLELWDVDFHPLYLLTSSTTAINIEPYYPVHCNELSWLCSHLNAFRTLSFSFLLCGFFLGGLWCALTILFRLTACKPSGSYSHLFHLPYLLYSPLKPQNDFDLHTLGLFCRFSCVCKCVCVCKSVGVNKQLFANKLSFVLWWFVPNLLNQIASGVLST